MAIIHGQIESLKTLRKKLELKNINRFNSISEINYFLDNYLSEKNEIYNKYRSRVESEIRKLEQQLLNDEECLLRAKKTNTLYLDIKIEKINCKLDILNRKKLNTFFSKFIIGLVKKLLTIRVTFLQKNYSKIITRSTKKLVKKVNKDKLFLEDIKKNKESISENNSAHDIKEVEYTKVVITGLNTIIAGAIGENLVVKEIKKLSDEHILLNDFSLNFKTPINNIRERDKIHSIQIDHLLVSKSGIFILETKNWSKRSVESLDLRSPVKQINRVSFALYKVLNKKIRLDKHHWGEKEVFINNLIVMIKNKPKEPLKNVKILTLNELNDHILNIDPIFNDREFKRVSNTLIKLHNKKKITTEIP